MPQGWLPVHAIFWKINAFNERDFVFNPGEIDAVVLTHAHIDHSGLIPKLVAQGYKGPVYCTKTTLELCGILLPDSAHIHESDAEFANRKGLRAGRKFIKPLYTVDEAYAALKNFVVRDFDTEFDVIPGIKVKFKVALSVPPWRRFLPKKTANAPS